MSRSRSCTVAEETLKAWKDKRKNRVGIKIPFSQTAREGTHAPLNQTAKEKAQVFLSQTSREGTQAPSSGTRVEVEGSEPANTVVDYIMSWRATVDDVSITVDEGDLFKALEEERQSWDEVERLHDQLEGAQGCDMASNTENQVISNKKVRRRRRRSSQSKRNRPLKG